MRLPPSRPSCENCWAKYFIYRIGQNSKTLQECLKMTASVPEYQMTKCGQTMILFQTDANRNIITVSHIVWLIPGTVIQNMGFSCLFILGFILLSLPPFLNRVPYQGIQKYFFDSYVHFHASDAEIDLVCFLSVIHAISLHLHRLVLEPMESHPRDCWRTLRTVFGSSLISM